MPNWMVRLRPNFEAKMPTGMKLRMAAPVATIRHMDASCMP